MGSWETPNAESGPIASQRDLFFLTDESPSPYSNFPPDHNFLRFGNFYGCFVVICFRGVRKSWSCCYHGWGFTVQNYKVEM